MKLHGNARLTPRGRKLRNARRLSSPISGNCSGGFRDPVSDAGDGLDCWGFSEFAAQSADGAVDGVGERVDVLVPCLDEEVFGAEDRDGPPYSSAVPPVVPVRLHTALHVLRRSGAGTNV
jgi:hypothetical protein